MNSWLNCWRLVRAGSIKVTIPSHDCSVKAQLWPCVADSGISLSWAHFGSPWIDHILFPVSEYSVFFLSSSIWNLLLSFWKYSQHLSLFEETFLSLPTLSPTYNCCFTNSLPPFLLPGTLIMLEGRNTGALIVRASPFAQGHTSYLEYKVCTGEMESLCSYFCYTLLTSQEDVTHSALKTKKFHFF